MKLTQSNKTHIDNMTYKQLLSHWFYAPGGDPWLSGETGAYWCSRIKELRRKPGGDSTHIAASKSSGWDK